MRGISAWFAIRFLCVALLAVGAAGAQTFNGTNVGSIPDGAGPGPGAYGAARDVEFAVSGTGGAVNTVSVSFNAIHPWVGDLKVTLIAPNAQEHLLFERTGSTGPDGGSPANLIAANPISFDDSASVDWWTAAGIANVDIEPATVRTVVAGPQASPPPAVTSLGTFNGVPADGTWILRFEDGWAGDMGSVTAASLTLTIGNGSPLGTAGNDVFDISNNGTNTVVVVNGGTPFVNPPGVTLNLDGLAGNDTFNINAIPQSILNLQGGANDDIVRFASGTSLAGGTADGGADSDRLDYSAFSTSVSVNLGSTAAFTGSIDGTQEVPSQATTASGTVTISNYSVAALTFDIQVAVTNLAPASVIGFHLHNGSVGTNGPIIIDLSALGPLVPAGGGFTFNATGVAMPEQFEAALFGGFCYFNVHTTAAPGGLIRGQIFPSGNFTATGGFATSTAGIAGFERVSGGSAGDSVVGSLGADTLNGGAGPDTLVGSRGADTVSGDAGADRLAWSNGDGSEVLDGGSELDSVQVNGAVAGVDAFSVSANGPRIAFARTSSGPFSLDIGTTEALIAAGIGGDDSFVVNNLTGVADLSDLRLAGFDGNDSFSVIPVPNGATRVISVNGGQPTATGDTLSVNPAGVANPVLSLNASGNGSFTSSSHQSIAITSIEAANPFASASAANVSTAGGSSHAVMVTYTDEAAIDVTTLGTGDITVTGPGGFNATPSFVSVNINNNGTPRVATYSFTPPGGSWDISDAGSYAISMQASQVADTSGVFVPAGSIGEFTVAIASTFTVTNTNDAGAGSLRQALADAVANGPGGDTIVFSSLFDTPQTIALQTELTLSTAVTINGPGAHRLTLSGGNAVRVLRLTAATTVTLSGVTISDGNLVGFPGGGVRVDTGTLNLVDCQVSNNAAGDGGGILNDGSLNLLRCSVFGNRGTSSSEATVGAGISSGGTLTVVNSTVSGNQVMAGGSVANAGGIYLYGGTASISSSTITGNTGANTGANAGGIGVAAGATATVRSTIVAANIGNTSVPDVSGAFVSNGFNLIGNIGSATGITLPTDLTGNAATPRDPGLLALGSHGGTTTNHTLRRGSQAIDAGINPGQPTDQRGFARTNDRPATNAIGGDGTDIGAIEDDGLFENGFE